MDRRSLFKVLGGAASLPVVGKLVLAAPAAAAPVVKEAGMAVPAPVVGRVFVRAETLKLWRYNGYGRNSTDV